MNQGHTNAGFSLVEVICAILILGVALVALTEGITAALNSSKVSEVQSTAALIAAGQIELLRADGILQDGETESDGEGGLSQYRWKQTISATPIDGLHEVALEVQSSKSGEAIYELRTLLFEQPEDTTQTGGNDRKTTSKSRTRGTRR